ncbi:hypothetical protein CCAX7_50470 [Capsulimonas corticalis]|uniref:Uncharacterized protein n=1 Tax=Capsulimonas corticalis TaxID=2219043 RepID=A0A402CP95_9BACT|nr:hypothetical protein [Capsulimonas corticalis]BDI32996.1 hypothetical protein CCAX7_50470 [Capsulimonas corticalis]
MSTPPYYQNTPPPSKSNSSGCWKIGGIGCAVVLLLGVVGSVWIFNTFKGVLQSTVGTTQNGLKIRRAVIDYHDKKGSYPAKLADLVPDYLPSPTILHDASDTNPDPSHISWTYHRPTEGAPPKTPLLENSIVIKIGNNPPARTSFIINLDGTTTSAGQTAAPPQ